MKREFNILNYFNMRALFMGIGISKILSTTNEYIPYTLILGTILGVLLLYFFKIELKNKTTQIIASSLIFLLGIINLMNMISTMYLTDMPRFIIGLPLVLLVIYILNKKEIVIFRTANVLLFLNVFLYIIATLSLVKYIDITNFTYTATNKMNILKGAIEYAFFSTTPTLLTRKKSFSDYSLIKTYIISSLTMGAIFLLTYGILGSSLVKIYRYPEYIILKKVTLGESLENIENIISFMWIFDVFIMILTAGNNIKDVIKNKKITFAVIFSIFLISTFISKFYVFIIGTYKYTIFILIFLYIILYLFNRKKRQAN